LNWRREVRYGWTEEEKERIGGYISRQEEG